MFFKGTPISHCQIKPPLYFSSISVIPAIWSSGFFFFSLTAYNLGNLRYHICTQINQNDIYFLR